jgi:hypothetical protein
MKVLLRQVSRYVYDVFFERGFDAHVRVRTFPTHTQRVFGLQLNKVGLDAVHRCIKENPFGSVDSVSL